MRSLVLVPFIVSLLFTACTSKNNYGNNATSNIDSTQGIWSIKEYLNDQYKLIKDDPSVLLKTVEENGKIDSSYVELFKEEQFQQIHDFFDKTDINNPTYRNMYFVEEHGDFANAYIFLTYTALNTDLLTQKLEISFFDETMKVVSVYIDTKKEGFFQSEFVKLNYNSMKSIVIQEDIKKLIGTDVRRVTKYYYNY